MCVAWGSVVLCNAVLLYGVCLYVYLCVLLRVAVRAAELPVFILWMDSKGLKHSQTPTGSGSPTLTTSPRTSFHFIVLKNVISARFNQYVAWKPDWFLAIKLYMSVIS